MIKVVEIIKKKWTVNMEEVDAENYPSTLDIKAHGYLFDNGHYDLTVVVSEDGWVKERRDFRNGKRQINNYLKIFGLSI